MTTKTEIQRIGFIGMGRMGQAIVPRLLQAGLPVTVWNRTPEKCTAAKELGATVASSPEELVQGSDIVFTMLHDDSSVIEMYRRLAPVSSGRRFLEMTTVQPVTHRAVSAMVRSAGGSYTDAPVIGTVGPAKAGQLVMMLGAPAADEAQLGSTLKHIARRCWWLGEVGHGATMKLSLNLILCSYWQLLGESLALAESGGLTREVMLDAIMDSPAGLPMLPHKREVLLGGSPPTAFDIAGVYKDMRAISAVAADLAVPTPVLQTAMGQTIQALRAGQAELDVAALTTFFVDSVRALSPHDTKPQQ